MRELFPNPEEVLTGITNTTILRPRGKLHIVHGCFEIYIRRSTNPGGRWDRPPHHICQRIIQGLTTKLEATLTQEAYAIYMSVKKLSFYIDTAKIKVKSDHLPLKKFLEKNTMNSKVNNWAVELESQNITLNIYPGSEILWQILSVD